ncbi:MAG: hypothetical protein M1827_004240 [Pycnora praestabilis]|nr:MAG: hypothetical protein M1827_004240 [Pycnora praestabilis]
MNPLTSPPTTRVNERRKLEPKLEVAPKSSTRVTSTPTVNFDLNMVDPFLLHMPILPPTVPSSRTPIVTPSWQFEDAAATSYVEPSSTFLIKIDSLLKTSCKHDPYFYSVPSAQANPTPQVWRGEEDEQWLQERSNALETMLAKRKENERVENLISQDFHAGDYFSGTKPIYPNLSQSDFEKELDGFYPDQPVNEDLDYGLVGEEDEIDLLSTEPFATEDSYGAIQPDSFHEERQEKQPVNDNLEVEYEPETSLRADTGPKMFNNLDAPFTYDISSRTAEHRIITKPLTLEGCIPELAYYGNLGVRDFFEAHAFPHDLLVQALADSIDDSDLSKEFCKRTGVPRFCKMSDSVCHIDRLIPIELFEQITIPEISVSSPSENTVSQESLAADTMGIRSMDDANERDLSNVESWDPKHRLPSTPTIDPRIIDRVEYPIDHINIAVFEGDGYEAEAQPSYQNGFTEAAKEGPEQYLMDKRGIDPQSFLGGTMYPIGSGCLEMIGLQEGINGAQLCHEYTLVAEDQATLPRSTPVFNPDAFLDRTEYCIGVNYRETGPERVKYNGGHLSHEDTAAVQHQVSNLMSIPVIDANLHHIRKKHPMDIINPGLLGGQGELFGGQFSYGAPQVAVQIQQSLLPNDLIGQSHCTLQNSLLVQGPLTNQPSQWHLTGELDDVIFEPYSYPFAAPTAPICTHGYELTVQEIQQDLKSLNQSDYPINLVSTSGHIVPNTVGRSGSLQQVRDTQDFQSEDGQGITTIPQGSGPYTKLLTTFSDDADSEEEYLEFFTPPTQRLGTPLLVMEELALGERVYCSGNMKQIPTLARSRTPSPVKSILPMSPERLNYLLHPDPFSQSPTGRARGRPRNKNIGKLYSDSLNLGTPSKKKDTEAVFGKERINELLGATHTIEWTTTTPDRVQGIPVESVEGLCGYTVHNGRSDMRQQTVHVGTAKLALTPVSTHFAFEPCLSSNFFIDEGVDLRSASETLKAHEAGPEHLNFDSAPNVSYQSRSESDNGTNHNFEIRVPSLNEITPGVDTDTDMIDALRAAKDLNASIDLQNANTTACVKGNANAHLKTGSAAPVRKRNACVKPSPVPRKRVRKAKDAAVNAHSC